MDPGRNLWEVTVNTQTANELQNTKQQVNALQEDLKQSRIEHSNEIQRMLESHQRDVKILQKNHDVKLQEQMEVTSLKHQAEVKAIRDDFQKTVQDFEQRFLQWTQQPPSVATTPSPPPVTSNKRSRQSSESVHNHSDIDPDDEDDYNQVREEEMIDQLPSQELQNLSLQASHKTQEDTKDSGDTRFHWQNPNGFQLVDPNGGTFLTAMEHMRDMKSDGGGFTEINLDTTKRNVQNKLRTAILKTSKQSKYEATSSSIPADNEYKPGGTISYVRDDLVSRFHSKGSDPHGRWSYIRLNSRGKKHITIITAYQPCTGKPKTDSMTVITQQYSSFLKEKRKKPEKVRKHFIDDLTNFMYSLKVQGDRFILAGDFNHTIGIDGYNMAQICRQFNLVDSITHRHGAPPPDYATYVDGNQVLDYILVDARLLPAITKCGYEPFYYRVHGDHRGMFIDFNTSMLFGKENTQLAPMAKRRLLSTNPEHVTVYIKHKLKYLRDHNFFSRIARLKSTRNDALAERLDQDLLRASLYAEARIPQYPEVPFSPTIAQLRNKLGLYRILLFQHHHDIELHDTLRESIASQYHEFQFPLTLDECKISYNATLAALKKAEREAIALRRNYLQKKASVYAESGELTAEAYLKRLKQCEDTARVFKKCKAARGKFHSGGFATIEVPADPEENPKACTKWRTVDCPKEIETLLLTRNRKHFGQSQGTPITVPPLSQEVNFEASTHTTDLILNGSYTHEDLDTVTQTLLDHLQRVSAPAVSSELTSEQFKSKIMSWNEKTSTSPSGQHLGHYKAMYAQHSIPMKDKEGNANEEYTKFEEDRNKLADAYVYLLNYALENGYSYTRWQKIVTMMIEKESGNHKIHRLRVIHIYEADYNALLCIKWREITHHSSKRRLINPAQNGGVPGCYAQDPVYVEELEYEISRATRTPLGKGDYDATSCYDRIHCFLANCSSQKYGLDRKVCIVQGRTLRKAKYHLRTQMGVSEGFIQHCKAYPIYGTGQGSGNSPVYWMFISSTLFDCHSLRAHGAKFTSPDGSISVTLYMLGFVDDTSNRTNYFERQVQPSINEIVRLMQHDTQVWSDLLYASGGELELTKCTYHHIRYTFDYKGRPHMKPGVFGPNLVVTNPKGERIIIDQLPVSTSHKLLGCEKDPAGTQKTSFTKIKHKVQELAKVVNNSTLDRHESLIFYRHIYIPSVTYPLFSTFFTEHQIDKIQSDALRSLTRSCGYNNNTSMTLLVGPSLYGCPAFTHMFDSQSFQQTQMFLKHWRSYREPGQVLRVAIAWWQFVAGISQPILAHPDIPLPHFEDESKYIKSLRRYLLSIGASIEVDDPGIPAIQREHDVHIIEALIKSEQFSTTELKYVNLCRLYLQVVTLSDIVNAAGTHIDPSIRAGTPSQLAPHSRWLKCHQERPRCKYVWKAWTKACNIFANYKGKLFRPLGKWLLDPNYLRCQFKGYYNPSTDHLYVWNDTHYTIHTRRGRLFSHSSVSTSELLPPTTAPADIRYDDDGILFQGTKSILSKVDAPPITTFDDLLSESLEWERRLFFELEWLQPQTLLLESILEGTLIIVSDGSAPDKASFGWIMSTSSGVRLVQCYGPTWGYHPSSYRAEGYGVLSSTCFLSKFIRYHHLTLKHSPTSYCDNKGLLDNLKKHAQYHGDHYPNDSMSTDWDVLVEILSIRVTLDKPPTLNHVKGHQDEEKEYASLSLQAQLNVDADALADKYMSHHYDQHRHVPMSTNAKALFHLPEGTVTNHLKRELLIAKRGPPALQYISETNNWTLKVAQSIDWDIHGAAFRGSPHPTTTFKFLHDLLPVGYRAHQNDPKYSPKCPDCDCEVETEIHFYSCPSEKRTKSKRILLQKFNKHIDKKNTDPILIDIMILGLESYLFNGSLPDPWRYPVQYRPLVSEQNSIGWKNFLKGRWSLKWRRLQKHHFQLHPTPKDKYNKKTNPDDPKQWSINLIKTLWNLWFEELWMVRNKSRHGFDQATRRQATRDQTLHELEQLYDRRHSISTHLRFIFNTPLHVLKEKRTHHLRNWISTWKPLIVPDSA